MELELQRMTLDEKIGQMLCAYITDEQEIFAMAGNGTLGALYTNPKGNTVEEAVDWINRLQAAAKYPILLCEDFEEGVRSIGTWLPTFMGIGATGDPLWSGKAGQVTARELKALGYGLIGSPVVDINTNPENPIINTRAYGSDAANVAKLAVAYIEAVQSEGLIATCKHFPGHGDSSLDSHREMAILHHDMERMEAVELLPYAQAIAAGVDAIMTSHLGFPAIEPDPRLPATLSGKILGGLLRGRMGFEGLILTDSMEMWAIKHNFTMEEWTALAVEAGVDILIVHFPSKVHAVLRQGVEEGRISPAKIDEAVSRIVKYKKRAIRPNLYPLELAAAKSVIGNETHRQIAEDLAAAGVTCLGDSALVGRVAQDGGRFLLVTMANEPRKSVGGKFAYETGRLGYKEQFEVTEEEPGYSALIDSGLPMARLLREKLGDRLEVVHYCGEPSGDLIAKAQAADCVILNLSVVNSSFSEHSAKLPERERGLCRELLQAASRSVLISTGNPYAVRNLEEPDCTVFTYGLCPASLRAAVRGLVGEAAFAGRLPVQLHV